MLTYARRQVAVAVDVSARLVSWQLFAQQLQLRIAQQLVTSAEY